MTELHVSLNPSQLNPVECKLQDPLGEQLTFALKCAAARVAERYGGQGEDEVAQWILDEARSASHPDIAEAFVI